MEGCAARVQRAWISPTSGSVRARSEAWNRRAIALPRLSELQNLPRETARTRNSTRISPAHAALPPRRRQTRRSRRRAPSLRQIPIARLLDAAAPPLVSAQATGKRQSRHDNRSGGSSKGQRPVEQRKLGELGGSPHRWGLSVDFGENAHLLIEKTAPGVRERSEVDRCCYC